MSLFIVIAVILVILYILSRLFEWVSDHKEAVLGFFCLVALIALICFLPEIWQFIWTGWKRTLSAWPMLLIIVACFGAYKYTVRKKKGEFLLWIDGVGITNKSEANVNQHILDLAAKDGSITTLNFGPIVSTVFYNQLLHWLDQPLALSKETFQNGCLQFAPYFQPDYSGTLLDHFSDTDKLFPISGTDSIYFSNSLKDTYIARFEEAGAATDVEFANMCKSMDTGFTICVDPQAVAATILNYLVSKGTTKKVELKDLDETLFVFKASDGGSNFVRHEINLDD